ncbi:RING finger protein 212B [Electrophorus electricus]|uniref:RING finger protein 212B n=1 Tax=Electrophorus electricus TaxID=8005 RepID=UPI0015CFF0A5|nr:RING finger protein 212B [Electrophorus electricus]
MTMDWFHCNNCFLRQGKNFVVSNCGHVFCESCVKPGSCSVCRATCNHLPLSHQMKPQERMFFTDPVNLIHSRLEHITQIALFQNKQKERVMAYHKHSRMETERRLEEVRDQLSRQVLELKKENTELKKPLSQRRPSPGKCNANSAIPRMTLPVAVTSPVTPRSRAVSLSYSADTMERFRQSRSSLMTPPGSATPVSSAGSLHEHGFRTPSSVNTPLRSDHITPNIFQFQLLPGRMLHSPQPWNVQ